MTSPSGPSGYLTRYLTGGDRQQVPVTLSTVEFIRKWCLHIQPEQLTKTRYFGGWSCQRRTAYDARCRELLAQTGDDGEEDVFPPAADLYSGETAAGEELPCCPEQYLAEEYGIDSSREHESVSASTTIARGYRASYRFCCLFLPE